MREVNDGVDRRPKSVVSPHFDCTRHNVLAERLKWRDLGASGQLLEWIRHGVAVPWLTGAPPPPFNQGVSCLGLPRDHAVFLQEEIERLSALGSPSTSGALALCVSRFPRPEAGRLRLPTHRGPARDKKRNSHAQDEDGDPPVSTFDCQAR